MSETKGIEIIVPFKCRKYLNFGSLNVYHQCAGSFIENNSLIRNIILEKLHQRLYGQIHDSVLMIISVVNGTGRGYRIFLEVPFSDSARSLFESLTSSHSHFFNNWSLFDSRETSGLFINFFFVFLIVSFIVFFDRVSLKKAIKSLWEVNEY